MPVNIHGKSYKTVAERLEEVGTKLKSVNTEVLYLEPQIMVKATIETDRGTFTGISAADPSKSIEAKTPVEVAETSAVGRALAFAGYAGSEIASADELTKDLTGSPSVTTATSPQSTPVASSTNPASPKQIDFVYKLIAKTNRDVSGVIFEFGAEPEKMTSKQASDAISKMMAETPRQNVHDSEIN